MPSTPSLAGSPRQARSTRQQRLLIAVDRALYRVSRHWLAAANGIAGIFALLPFVAPLLAATGHSRTSGWIDRGYSFVCSQQPTHTFHLFGRPLACCERCLAIYLGIWLLGLGFALRRRVGPAALLVAIILSLPMLGDGLSQLAGLRQSDWELRLLTGSLFALAVVWWLYPRLDRGFAQICDTLERRFQKLAAEGRASPL